MVRKVVHNIVELAFGVAIYAVLFRVLTGAFDWFEVAGGTRLLTMLGFFALFGVAGGLAFTGVKWLRAGLVLVVVMLYALGLDILSPDPRHQMVQSVVSVPFAAIAAGISFVVPLRAGKAKAGHA